MRMTRPLLVALLCSATLIAVTATNAVAGARRPPCTKAALDAGVHRGYDSYKTISEVLKPWGCAGRFAYGGFAVTTHGITNGIMELFIADHDHWITADRSKWCVDHAVPRKIYRPACTFS
jgi:hypothetical protein